MVFISHANPEDNEFSRWLALRLAVEGYAVWCDLTKLLGGERFWGTIEDVIRNRTAKFVYVLSRTSNSKQGCLGELELALTVSKVNAFKDFIIPLKIDDLPHSDINIRLSGVNATPSMEWAAGLAKLIEKLQLDGVPRAIRPGAVAEWWNKIHSALSGTVKAEDSYFSNWFPVMEFPRFVYFHDFTEHGARPDDKPSPKWSLPLPALRFRKQLISFASRDELDIGAGPSTPYGLEEFLGGAAGVGVKEARALIIWLFSMAFEKKAWSMGLRQYVLANGKPCYYFAKGLLKNDTIWYTGADEGRFRKMVGFKSWDDQDGERAFRYWHFGITAKPSLSDIGPPHLVVQPHVLFSDDGITLWSSKTRHARARRSQCRSWWNAEWRDRILATMQWLSSRNDGSLVLETGGRTPIKVSSGPRVFTSAVSYLEPRKVSREVFESGDNAPVAEGDEIVEETGSDKDLG